MPDAYSVESYAGLSTAVKPANASLGATFSETDTGIGYMNTATGWKAVIGGGSGTTSVIVTPTGGLSPNSFGPNTPGTTTAGMNEAINSIKATGGKVVLAAGNYTITSTITLPSGVMLEGSQIGFAANNISSVVSPTNIFLGSLNAAGIHVVANTSLSYQGLLSFPAIANLSVIGPSNPALSSQDGILIDDSLGNIFDMYIDHVGAFTCGGNGINNNSSSGNLKLWIDACYMENNELNGYLQTFGDTVRLRDSYVYSNAQRGINIVTAGTAMIEGNMVWQNATEGINLQSVGSAALVTNNDFVDNGSNTKANVLINSVHGHGLIFNNNTIVEDRASNLAALYGMQLSWQIAGDISHNSIYGTYHTQPVIFQIGSSSNFITFKTNYGANPSGLITNPFLPGNVIIPFASAPSNGVAVPTASTDYVINATDVFITSANSSNSNNAIVVKDGAGNTVSSPGSTMTAQYVPSGYKVNWGAFTGTAGAVSVWGV